MKASRAATAHNLPATMHKSTLAVSPANVAATCPPPPATASVASDQMPAAHTLHDLHAFPESETARLAAMLEQERVYPEDGTRMLKIAFVTTAPQPHKVPVFFRLSEMPGVKLHVLFCSRHAPDRIWNSTPLDFDHSFLSDRPTMVKGHAIHHNPGVVSRLKQFAPDVIMTDGFQPTHLYAFAYAAIKGIPHVPIADGSDAADDAPGGVRHALRRFVYERSAAFVSASDGGHLHYQAHGIEDRHRFTSRQCIDNARFMQAPPDGAGSAADRRFDFIFVGPLEPARNPLFALDVAIDVAKRIGRRVAILFTGGGSLEPNLRQIATEHRDLVLAEFFGIAAQDQLPALYRSARVLLLPARWARWDIAANQACAAGLPAMTSPRSGVAGELVIDEENGYVRDLEVEAWSKPAASLLTQQPTHERFARRSRELVADFTFDKAAEGLLAACRHALSAYGRQRSRNGAGGRPRVVIVERQLLHYRVSVYERLRALLDKEGVELQLLIGEGTPEEKKKKDEAVLDWTIKLPTRYLLGDRICWQPFGAYARGAELVIVMHENKLVYNLWLMTFGRPRRLAFWGHGRNMQSDQPDGIKERFKRWTVNKVDWWFAYTDSSAALVTYTGFPRARTTVVDNAVDTRKMIQFCNEIDDDGIQRLRAEMGLESGPVALYVGSLYKDKRLDFLLDAARRIRAGVPGFQLLVVGAGPDQGMIEDAAREHRWIRYLGPLHGRDKANVLALADLMLNPGLVGLGILDSFVSGSPMFTTDCGLHSPEISYMESGQNGVMTDDDVIAYSGAVIAALNDPAALDKLKQGALATAPRYTVENMANRLCNGIMACIASV
jgi:glycosyltransferase involved in cell wall biosynthesis